MLMSTDLPCGIKINSRLSVLDLLTRGRLHLSKGWASGWLRLSHLLISRPVNILLRLSGPTRPGVGFYGPYIRSCSPRGLWCGRLVLTAHIHQILLFGPGLYPRFPGALVLVLLFRFHTGQALIAMVVLYWRSPSVRIDATRVPLKGNVQLRL